MSRSEEEIKKRVIYLVQMIEKEGEIVEEVKDKPSADKMTAEINAILDAS